MNGPYETTEPTERQIERLLGRALNSFDLPDTLIERLHGALAHASSLTSAHHGAGLHRELYRHTYLLTDSSALTVWELVHNACRDGAQVHELYTQEADARLAASRLVAPGGTAGTGPGGESTADFGAGGVVAGGLVAGGFGAGGFGAEFTLLGSLLVTPAATPQRMYVADNSPDHARRVLRRAENLDHPGEETARLLRTAFAHHIAQVYGKQCQIDGKSVGFTLYEHAFLLIDGSETSLWEVEHTATPDRRHMCEVYAQESAAREAMRVRSRVGPQG